MFGPEYPKINTVWKRDERNVIVPGDWSCEEFAYLADLPWTWTEKVDGTNIRLHYDAGSVTVGGRTDNAQVPATLIAALNGAGVLDPGRWDAIFGPLDKATVYGEGYGAKIQKGGQYRPDQTVIVFDVLVDSWWLRPGDVLDVATKLGLDMVPSMGTYSLNVVLHDFPLGEWKSQWPDARIEGLVGRPAVDLHNRRGEKILVKVKAKDFADYERRRADA